MDVYIEHLELRFSTCGSLTNFVASEGKVWIKANRLKTFAHRPFLNIFFLEVEMVIYFL